jgi:starvation-inducible DNA-binding protein
MSELNQSVLKTLHRQQANAMVLYLNTKKYHWLTYGAHFRDIHLLLDEQATALIDEVDEYAERAIMLDGTPLADPARYLGAASVKPSEGAGSLRQMLGEAVAGHETIISELHADAEVANKAGDIGTVDLYTRLVQVHQKQRWFLREILRNGSGIGE